MAEVILQQLQPLVDAGVVPNVNMRLDSGKTDQVGIASAHVSFGKKDALFFKGSPTGSPMTVEINPAKGTVESLSHKSTFWSMEDKSADLTRELTTVIKGSPGGPSVGGGLQWSNVMAGGALAGRQLLTVETLINPETGNSAKRITFAAEAVAEGDTAGVLIGNEISLTVDDWIADAVKAVGVATAVTVAVTVGAPALEAMGVSAAAARALAALRPALARVGGSIVNFLKGSQVWRAAEAASLL